MYRGYIVRIWGSRFPQAFCDGFAVAMWILKAWLSIGKDVANKGYNKEWLHWQRTKWSSLLVCCKEHRLRYYNTGYICFRV